MCGKPDFSYEAIEVANFLAKVTYEAELFEG
jgi:hypothetical protein